MNPGPLAKLQNSDIIKDLRNRKLSHLTSDQQADILALVNEFQQLFPDHPSQTDKVKHDIQLCSPDQRPVNRCSLGKQRVMDQEIQYMLENGIVERCTNGSEWSSLCILVPKPDGSYRFCTDFRRVNAVTKSDTFPLLRIDDCIDRVGQAVYVSKFDLLKGYWEVPLTDRAKEISTFVTPTGLYQYQVMPFGLKIAPATFQRMMNAVVGDLEGTDCYIDDAIVSSMSWKSQLQRIRALFVELSRYQLTVNLTKSEFRGATVMYLSHIVGQGKLLPLEAKVQGIYDFPVPQEKKALQRFLGMAGYYRRFCKNFPDIVSPLTDLLVKGVEYLWTERCQIAFDKVRAVLVFRPVLASPDLTKPFKLAVEANDIGIEVVLLQDQETVEHLVCYYAKKLDKHQRNYSTIEKEALALLTALKHFRVYLDGTNHNPLTFMARMKDHNQRLLRWYLTLQEYDLCILHIRGKNNVVADALSRC